MLKESDRYIWLHCLPADPDAATADDDDGAERRTEEHWGRTRNYTVVLPLLLLLLEVSRLAAGGTYCFNCYVNNINNLNWNVKNTFQFIFHPGIAIILPSPPIP